ncbi:MAG: NAD(P)HX epimerase / NAD(P)HX dehydratase [uncultured Thiotrichaceae bacterium]|uniref:Bifunctional NAD(P)H-hydrate repair enzyme n=1 Tax=uncultured Thiotrichaceae bacterium TaxID=298394 RepID=A0A6S6T6R1_9GAMM|nr:MAG: NAD(P)HX epimerase / NAD(P)HX dehydratase [uncultured Thiotrichaceae bacterium]
MDEQQRKHAVYTTQQVRELDRIAIEVFKLPGYLLMTRAAQAAFDLAGKHWPEAQSVCVICGAGNNAGDGYVFARLALATGWQVNVQTVVDSGKLGGDAQQAYLDYIAADGKVAAFEPDQSLPDCDLIVDALLGTGLQREVTGLFQQAIEQINTHSADVLAMDIPSGLHADTGQACGIAVAADLTVTFIAMKQGLLTGQARQYTGEIQLAGLDIPDEAFTGVPTDQHIISQAAIKAALKPRLRHAHKGQHGHSLLIGGTAGMSGAIQLAGAAALRCGSGLVSIATHPAHAAWLNLNRPELMVHAIASADPVQQLRSLPDKKTALGIGPGLGKDAWAQQLLLLALDTGLPLVIDADALNLLAGMNRRQDNWILTPHPAEAARLLVCSTANIEADRVKAARTLQQRFGGVCVLKGAGTLIASKQGVAFCTSGNPGMASGGMGDVLTGIITALLAQGLDNMTAAHIGVQIHAEAADQAAMQGGERGLLASDVIGQLRSQVNP